MYGATGSGWTGTDRWSSRRSCVLTHWPPPRGAADRHRLLDHLIRPRQQRRRDRQAEGLGGLEVDDQLELRRLLDGQIARLGALENLVHVGRGAPKQISKVRSIGHKAPGIDILPPWKHRWQPGLGRQVHEASSLTEEHGAYQHSQSTRAPRGHVREGPVEVLRPSRLNELKPHPQRPRRDVCFLQYVLIRAFALATWLPEDSDPTDPRNGLREQFETLADDLRGGEHGQPCGIAARPRKAGDERACNRIGNTEEDNGEGPGRLLGGQSLGCASGQDDINLERNQFGRKSGEPLGLPLGISVLDHDVAALDVTEVTQPWS